MSLLTTPASEILEAEVTKISFEKVSPEGAKALKAAIKKDLGLKANVRMIKSGSLGNTYMVTFTDWRHDPNAPDAMEKQALRRPQQVKALKWMFDNGYRYSGDLTTNPMKSQFIGPNPEFTLNGGTSVQVRKIAKIRLR